MPGDLKSGIPAAVDIPAPVMTMILEPTKQQPPKPLSISPYKNVQCRQFLVSPIRRLRLAS